MAFYARGAVHGLRDPRDRRPVQRVNVQLEPNQGESESFFSPPGMITSLSVDPANPDKLGLGTQAQARERDFANQYTGSQIAPMWTGALESLRGHRVSMDPSWARNQGIADDPESTFNTSG